MTRCVITGEHGRSARVRFATSLAADPHDARSRACTRHDPAAHLELRNRRAGTRPAAVWVLMSVSAWSRDGHRARSCTRSRTSPSGKGARGTAGAPRRSRFSDRACSTAGASSRRWPQGDQVGGPLRRRGAVLLLDLDQLQGRQRPVRPQGGRRPAQGASPRRSGPHPRDRRPGAARRRRVRRSSCPKVDAAAGRGGRRRHREGAAPPDGACWLEHQIAQVTASVGVALFDGLDETWRSWRGRPRDVRGQGGGPEPVRALIGRAPGAHRPGAWSRPSRFTARSRTISFELHGQPILDLASNEIEPVRAAPPACAPRNRRAAPAQRVPVRRRALRLIQ